MHPCFKFSTRSWLGAVTATLIVAGGASGDAAAVTSMTKTYAGTAVHMGKGTAQVVVVTNAKGQPLSIAVQMTPDALDGLPSELNKKATEGGWEFPLPVPAEAHTGFTEVMIDWNPHGHPPPDVYTVPHFDFHFYTVSPATVKGIKFSGPTDPAAEVSDNDLVPQDYQVVPDTVVNSMGVHAIDTKAPEFNGKPFTSTFIYGYYKDRLIFLEPMVTLAFLHSKPNFSAPVKIPAHYSSPGYYPTKYGVRYDAAQNGYVVEFSDLKHWK